MHNKWYEYFIISFDSLFLPDKVYLLEDHSLAIFISKGENDLSRFTKVNNVSQKMSKIGILIYRPKGELTLSLVRKTLDDFITCFCLLKPDYMLFSAFIAALETLNESFKKDVKRTRNIADILKKIHFKQKRKQGGIRGFVTDFTSIIYGFQSVVGVNFLSAFKKFVDLEQSDKDYQAIKLLVLSSLSKPLTGKFYDNANLRYSLMFTLLESFLPKEKKQVQYKCKSCGALKNNTIDSPVSLCFSNYVDNLPISDHLKKRAKRTFECMRPIRNKFYHDAEYDSNLGVVNDIEEITGKKTMTYQEDLELNAGRTIGPRFMEEFIRAILIVRLINKKDSDDFTEFQPNLLWDNFKPMSVIGNVDISFSSFSSLHVGILDFEELEKRIHLCKKDKICKDRDIRQHYFYNQNSNSPILVLCDTPNRYCENNTEDQKESDLIKTWNKNFVNIIKALSLDNAYITNLVKCGSRNNFDKDDISVRNCWQFFLKEIDLCNPKVIICVGKDVYDIVKKRNLKMPIEYVPHYLYRSLKNDTIINRWKAKIEKYLN